MLDNLPDWVGAAVAAFIAGAFGTLAAMAKARTDNSVPPLFMRSIASHIRRELLD